MMKTNRKYQFAFAVLFMAFVNYSHAAEVSVSIQPNTFSAGQGGQLSVTAVNGNFDEGPSPVSPPGVLIRPYGQSRNVQILNGKMTQSVTQNFVVSADQPGSYTIPSFEVKIGGKRLTTDPVQFEVTASGARSGGSMQQPGSSAAPSKPLGFLRLDFPKRDRDHLYVGEMAPVRIKAYFPPDTQVSLRSAPRPEGQGFTLHNLSEEPEQNFEVVNGERYRTVTWFAGISLAKAGEYPVTVGLDATIMVPDRSTQGRRSNPLDSFFGGSSMFNDPFFDNFFDNAFTRTIPREVTLTSPGDPLEVRSLPREDRPENFSGAVGEFSLGGYLLPADAKTGEPQKIRVTVNGKGNFDRLSAPTLEPADAWKTYKPKTEFTAGDAASFSGNKVFEFSAVPQKSGDQSLALSFSYFNPTTGKYQTEKSQTIQLAVTGEDVKSTAELTNTTPVPPKTSDSRPELQTELAPIRPIVGNYTQPLVPLLYSKGYLAALWIGIFGIIGGFAISAVRKRRDDPQLRAERLALHKERSALDRATDAIAKNDSTAFFEAARNTLQERYGRIWNRPPEAITLAELRAHLPANSPAIQLFSQADAMAYAPQGSRPGTELKRWQKSLHEALEEASTSDEKTER